MRKAFAIKFVVSLIICINNLLSATGAGQSVAGNSNLEFRLQARREVEKARSKMRSREYEEAAKHYETAYKLIVASESAEDRALQKECVQGVGESMYRIAMIQEARGHHAEALKYMDKAAVRGHPKAISQLNQWNALHNDTGKKQKKGGEGVVKGRTQNVPKPDASKVKDMKPPVIELDLGCDGLFGEDDEEPETIKFVWIPYEGGFWISETELTRGQAAQILGSLLDSSLFAGWTRGGAYGCSSAMPMDNLTTLRCQIIIDTLNEDPDITVYVPSETQMVAIHKSNKNIQMWNVSEFGWFSGKSVHEAKQKKPTDGGLYDFYGNVSEICRNANVTQSSRLKYGDANWRGGCIGSDIRYVCGYGKEDEDYRGVRLCIKVPKLGKNGGKHIWSCSKKPPIFSRKWYYGGGAADLYGMYWDVAMKMNFKLYSPKHPKCLDDLGFRFNIQQLPENSEATSLVLRFYSDLVKLSDKLIDLEEVYNKTRKGDQHYDIGKYVKIENDYWRQRAVEAYKQAHGAISDAVKDLCFWDAVCADPSLSRIKSSNFYNHISRGVSGNNVSVAVCEVDSAIGFLMFEHNYNHEIERKENELKKKGALGVVTDKDIMEIFKLKEEAFVVVTAGNLTGSGFIIKDGNKKYMYTNKHVLEKGGKCTTTCMGGKRIRCKNLEFNSDKDLARGEIDGAYNNVNGCFEFSDSHLTIGEDIFVIGNSDGLGVLKLLRGKIVGLSPDSSIIEIDAPIVEGNSGSAVINAAGEVVGIATFRYGERRFAIRPSASDAWKRIDWKKYNESLGTKEEVR